MTYEIYNSEKSKDTLDIYIYNDVDEASIWNKESVGADKFRQLLEKNKNAKNINVYINSRGGSVSEGVAIYSQIKRHPAKVTAYIDGYACSIASVIPMAADKVVMSDTSMMMIHNPWTIAAGNSEDLRKVADDLDKVLEGSIIPAYKNKVGDKISDEKLRTLLSAETYLTSKECLEYGLCDEILESDKKEETKKEVQKDRNAALDKFRAMCEEKFLAKSHEIVRDETPEQAEPEEPEQPAEPAEPETETPEEPETPVSEPETPTEETHAETPVVDKSEIHNYFMKILKGEM